jgi:hypothetical protein
MTIILFAPTAPHPLADELEWKGFTVYAALAISEVLALVQEHPEAQIVITYEIEPERAKIIQQRYPTIVLKRFASESH